MAFAVLNMKTNWIQALEVNWEGDKGYEDCVCVEFSMSRQ